MPCFAIRDSLSSSEKEPKGSSSAAGNRGPGLWGTAEACEPRPDQLGKPGAGAGHQADRSPQAVPMVCEEFHSRILSSFEHDYLTRYDHLDLPNQWPVTTDVLNMLHAKAAC